MASRKYLVGVYKREQQQQNSLGVCHGKLIAFFQAVLRPLPSLKSRIVLSFCSIFISFTQTKIKFVLNLSLKKKQNMPYYYPKSILGLEENSTNPCSRLSRFSFKHCTQNLKYTFGLFTRKFYLSY